MEQVPVKATYVYSNYSMSAEGTSEFVVNEIVRFHEFLNKFKVQIDTLEHVRDTVSEDGVTTNSTQPKFENAISIKDGVVKILKNLIGSKRERIITIIYIYLWAKHSIGVESVNIDEIRKVCVEHGCYDSKNFASYLRDLKDVIKEGSNVRLSVPARKVAEDLLSKLNNG